MKNIKVLIVDDSAIVRNAFTKVLSQAPGIEIVGGAADAYVARDKIVKLKPDVITLDINMPRMDGLTFLKKLMKHYPLPVIMVSGVSDANAKMTLKSLEYGAVEFIAKPGGGPDELKELSMQLIEKIKAAASAKIGKKLPAMQNLGVIPASKVRSNNNLIVLGASTGGTEALRSVLRRLPSNVPPILVVQHMPENFTKTFSESLNNQCAFEVREAKDGDRLGNGLALIAPGGYQMCLKRIATNYYVSVNKDEPVSGHRPSVDALFYSVAKHAKTNIVGVIMTGMGADGSKGMLELKNIGAKTIAQDEASCVVFGMPKEAIKLGAASKVSSLNRIPETIVSML